MSKKQETSMADVAGVNTGDPPPPSTDPQSDDNWTSDDVPCFAMGEGMDKKGNPRHKRVQGVYLYSVVRRIKRRNTTLHRFAKCIVDGEKVQGECLVYGSGSVNHKMASIPEHTPVRLTYLGEIDTGQDSPMKNILVEWPRGTKLVNKAPPRVDEDNSDDDNTPF